MTREEIFSAISSRQIEGIMLHDQMAQCFTFLHLDGYKRLQEFRFMDEAAEHRNMVRYYIERYNRLIPGAHASNPAILPESWMGRTRLEVDTGIKRMAVKDLFKRWVNWESSTVSRLQAHAQALYSTGDIVCADYIGRMAQDVADELKTATGMMIDLEAVDYDMTAILDRQPALHRKYKHKLQEIGEAFS